MINKLILVSLQGISVGDLAEAELMESKIEACK